MDYRDFGDWLLGARKPRAKAAFLITCEGYILRLKPSHPKANAKGYIPEHVYKWEQFHKACLLPCSAVFHKDGNPRNNRRMNLVAKYRKRRLRNK